MVSLLSIPPPHTPRTHKRVHFPGVLLFTVHMYAPQPHGRKLIPGKYFPLQAPSCPDGPLPWGAHLATLHTYAAAGCNFWRPDKEGLMSGAGGYLGWDWGGSRAAGSCCHKMSKYCTLEAVCGVYGGWFREVRGPGCVTQIVCMWGGLGRLPAIPVAVVWTIVGSVVFR